MGMQNLDNSITEMYSNGYLDREEAIARSANPGKMEKTLKPNEQFDVVQKPEAISNRRGKA
jgi:hypothetical protein